MRLSLPTRQTQSTLESIINRASNYSQPTIDDLDSLRPHQIPTKLSDKVQLYQVVYKRLDNAFTKYQLRHLTKELKLRPPSKITKHNLVDLLLKRWGVHSELYLTKQKQVESLRRSEASDVVVLPDHALFLLLGQDGQGHHQLIASRFGVKVSIRRSPKLALSLVGTNDGVSNAKDFLDSFVNDTLTSSVDVKDAEKRLSKSVLLGISRISHTYLDPSSLSSDNVKMYAQHQHNLDLATRLLYSHLRESSNEQEKVVLAPGTQPSLTLLPFEFRDERPWDMVQTPYQLGIQRNATYMLNPNDVLSVDDLFSQSEILNQSAHMDKNGRIEIELGHYLYLQDNEYVAKSDVDLSLLPKPRFVPSVNPSSLKIPLKGTSRSPQLSLTYSTNADGDNQRIFSTVLSQAMDGEPIFDQSISNVSVEGLVLPGLPTDARVSKHIFTDSFLGLDVVLGRWIEEINSSGSENRMPPLSLTDSNGVEWHLDQHTIANSGEDVISPGIKLIRESVVNNETNQAQDCARISLHNETLGVDRESIHRLLTQKWSFVYDHIKWSRPPREYQEYQEKGIDKVSDASDAMLE